MSRRALALTFCPMVLPWHHREAEGHRAESAGRFLFFVQAINSARYGLEFLSIALFSVCSAFLGFSVVPREFERGLRPQAK